MGRHVRHPIVFVVVSVLVLLAFGLGALLNLWHEYVAVRAVAGIAYTLIGAVIGFIAGERRASR